MSQRKTVLQSGKVTADAVATALYLRKDARSNGKVGVVGFCWGGGVANQLAVHDANLIEDAAGALEVRDGAFQFNLHPYEIKTFKLELKTNP